MRYFWREKNADSFEKKAVVTIPIEEQLESELIKKLDEKKDKLDIVFDKDARAIYLKKNDKKIPENLSEKQIRRVLGRRLACDLLQLYYDFCDFYGFEKNSKLVLRMNKEELERELDAICDSLFDGVDTQRMVANICVCARSLAHLLHINFSSVKDLQERCLESEGSFLKGKYVEIDS